MLYGLVTLLYDICRRRVHALLLLLARRLLHTVSATVEAHGDVHATAAEALQRAADERPCCILGILATTISTD